MNYSASLISMIESGHRSPSRDFALRTEALTGRVSLSLIEKTIEERWIT